MTDHLLFHDDNIAAAFDDLQVPRYALGKKSANRTIGSRYILVRIDRLEANREYQLHSLVSLTG